MDQRLRAAFGRRLGDIGRAGDMEPVEIALEDPDEIDHRLGPGHRAADLVALADVGGDELELPEPAERLEIKGAARIAAGDADARHPLADQTGRRSGRGSRHHRTP